MKLSRHEASHVNIAHFSSYGLRIPRTEYDMSNVVLVFDIRQRSARSDAVTTVSKMNSCETE